MDFRSAVTIHACYLTTNLPWPSTAERTLPNSKWRSLFVDFLLNLSESRLWSHTILNHEGKFILFLFVWLKYLHLWKNGTFRKNECHFLLVSMVNKHKLSVEVFSKGNGLAVNSQFSTLFIKVYYQKNIYIWK